MKSLKDLWRNSALELAEWCHTCATFDIKTVERRVEEEGFSFYTITLPAFGKEFERALEVGRVDSTSFPGWKRRQGIPVFMSGYLSQIFDNDSGTLLSCPPIDCIFAVRQLTNLYAKIELPCSNSRVVRAMEGYVSCEQEVQEWESTADPSLIERFRKASHFLFSDVFTRVDHLVYAGDIRPHHGPGKTADGLLGNQKFRMPTWTERLERVFPYGEYALPIWSEFDRIDEVDFLEPGSETPVKVVPVPKTLRTPRIIAQEPTHMQFMQQGLLEALVPELEDSRWPFSGFIGFEQQGPNRSLARRGSLTGELATLDLKEASDRVPNLLVKVMTENWPWLSAGVQASRSTRAEISKIGVSIPRLAKFASMGSALCFPFEAMVFFTVVMMALSERANVPLSRDFVLEFRGKVRVYGDDIIVPTDSVADVISYLEAFGFRVNRDKSFWNGKFRESCGGDFYDGSDVTPVRLKKEFPLSPKDGSKVAALVKFRNRLYLRGMWRTARYLDDWLLNLLGGHFPVVEITSPCLGRLSFLPYQAERMDEKLHSPRVKGWVLRPVVPSNSIDGIPALVKCLGSNVTIEDPRHLERSGRPAVVGTKLRWVVPF